MEFIVFFNLKVDVEIYWNEIFGLVLIVKIFESEEEVLKMVNDIEYGLMFGVFIWDIIRVFRVVGKFDLGVVGINCVSYVSFWEIYLIEDDVK